MRYGRTRVILRVTFTRTLKIGYVEQNIQYRMIKCVQMLILPANLRILTVRLIRYDQV